MTPWQAVVLGAVQGLGEFLPISSSGHLIVVPWLLGWPEHSLAFDVALHLGTLAAVLGAFAGDWWRLARGAWRALRPGAGGGEAELRLLLLLGLGTLPAVVCGLLLERRVESLLRSPLLVALALAALGVVLFAADRRAGTGSRTLAALSVRDAALVGLAQALALVPGVSRSGATISMALFLGYRREEAARFSFLLALPVTAGAAVLKVPELWAAGEERGLALWGILVAGLLGWAAIQLLLGWVRTRDYRPFVYYRWALAALVLAVWFRR